MTKLEILTQGEGWYGKHSGFYGVVPELLEGKFDLEVSTRHPCNSLAGRIAGGLYSRLRGWEARNQSLTAAEMQFLLRFLPHPKTRGLVLNLEEHLPLLRHWRKAPRRLMGCIHFPRLWWEESQFADLKRLSSALVLYRSDMEFFESAVGAGRVRFVPHGVDTDYFRPAAERLAHPPRVLFVGQFYRNPKAFVRICSSLRKKHPDLEIVVITAAWVQKFPSFECIRDIKDVIWLSGITDDELKKWYQQSTVLLLPLSESGANNAIVEAMASGLPVATTDVGGVRDYGGGTLYPVAAYNDEDGLAAIADSYIESAALREETGARQRRFAVESLDWQKVIPLYFESLQHLSGGAG